MKNSVVVFTVTSAIAAACRAASPAPLPESLLACAKLQDPTERVHCYDTEIAALSPSTMIPTKPAGVALATPSPVPPPPVAPSPVPPSPVAAAPVATSSMPARAPIAPAIAPPTAAPAQFGDEQLPTKPRAAAPKEEVLQSKIAAVNTVGQKMYLISLANGQVWRQEGSQLPALFKVGSDVRIERGAFGSYHLSVAAFGDKNWVLVTRTK